MITSDQCHQNAEHYFKVAERTHSKKRKRRFALLALEWLRLAELTKRYETLARTDGTERAA